jgi:nitroimidazol reductase NimA-like FMN-containing flavoprotein (pyridoxamine 5'-phosphate oxidase superfamily)
MGMAEIEERTGLEVLDRHECIALLAKSSLGRIAVVGDGSRPLIFPVNFALDGDAIVLRTDPGTKLRLATRGWVAFECDGIEGIYHTGWSVLASGVAEEVHYAAEIAELERLPLARWCPGPKSIWMRIRPRVLTGRRVPPHGRSQAEEAPK